MERFVESESDTEGAPMDGITKRKSPSVDGIAPVLPTSPMDTGSKHPRKYSFEPELPPLRDNEAEMVLNIHEFISEVESSDIDSTGFSRIERNSDRVVLQGLTFTLVSYLTRRLDHDGAPSYDLGLYVKVEPPTSGEDSWSYRSVSMMVMLINASNPYSDDSKVCRDTCQFNSNDPCRGWSAMISFRSLNELQQKGFTYNTALVKCRGQVSFEGSPIILPPHYVVPYQGLENMGATCYLAALLQSLFHIGSFRELVYSSPAADGSDILSALQCVFSDLEESDTSGVSAEPLTHAFGWDLADVGIQHDAQELNRILIDRIESFHKEEVTRMFSGEIENYIECLDVEYTSRRVEKFYDLQMNLVYHDPQTGDPHPITSLEEATEKYLTPEILDGQNLYDAESFGKQRARKGVRFLSLPPVLSFQLMRFQFDYESCEMKKLNTKFSFPETLIMSEGLQYVLHSVLVHSGNVNAGHYYAYVRPDGRTDWFKFDDTEVRKVDSFTAIQNNFGGPHFRDNLVDYLHETSDDSNMSSQRDKVFSAYMLTYVRADSLDEVLRGSEFSGLPQSVREGIHERKKILKEKLAQVSKRTSRRRRGSSSGESSAVAADDELVPLRIIELDGEQKIFDSLVTSTEAIKSSWLTDFDGIPYAISNSVVDVPGTELISTALRNLFGEERPRDGEIFFMVSDPENRVRFLELSDNEAASATMRDLSRHVAPAPVVLVVSYSLHETSGEKFFVVEFDAVKQEFEYRGIVNIGSKTEHVADQIKQAIRNEVWGENACEFFAHTKYFNLERLDDVKTLDGGMFIVFENRADMETENNALDFMKTLGNTFDIDLYLHDALRDKWLLGEVPAIEHALLPNHKSSTEWKRPIDHMRVSVDIRNDVNSLGNHIPGFSSEVADLLVFCDDPLLDEVKAGEDVNQEGWKMVDVVSRRGLQFHCAPIPKRPPASSPERWLETKPVCVRYFSPKVLEEKCGILYVSANMSVGEILEKAKECLGVEGRCRMLEIEPHDCEIIAVHGEGNSSPASTLTCWGARNILASSLRVEMEERVPEATTDVWCHHYERATRRRFGHPFILQVPTSLAEDTRRESILREMIAEKLDVPLQTVRGWRIGEATGSNHTFLEITHPSNPWTTRGTPRERGLVIKG